MTLDRLVINRLDDLVVLLEKERKQLLPPRFSRGYYHNQPTTAAAEKVQSITNTNVPTSDRCSVMTDRIDLQPDKKVI